MSYRRIALCVLLIVAAVAFGGCGDSPDSAAADRPTIRVPLKPSEVPDTSDLPESFSYTIEQARKGDPEAMFQLGWAYTEERSPLPMDPGKAVKWFHLSAIRGNVLAQYNLGLSYAKGEGVEIDQVKANEWLLKAAKQGDVDAQFSVGVMFDKGVGVSRDDAAAAFWYRKAAEQGNAPAQLNLGTMYKVGQGVGKDLTEAAKWYQMAAVQGEPGSQYSLGEMYLNGDGVQRDAKKAYIWLTLSKPWYPKDTEEPLKELRRKLTKEQLAEAKRFIGDFDYNHPRYVIPKREE